jgi:hypothetical protein
LKISAVTGTYFHARSTAAWRWQMSVGTPVQRRLQNDELEALDRRRRKQSNPPTRSQELLKLIRPILLDVVSSQGDGGCASRPTE